jgi:hypothetical protein
MSDVDAGRNGAWLVGASGPLSQSTNSEHTRVVSLFQPPASCIALAREFVVHVCVVFMRRSV